MTAGVRNQARRETVAPTRPGPIAADAFEARIENTILRCEDLFDRDGDTLLRRRNGRIETCDVDAFVIEP